MQRPSCEPESLITTQRRPVVKKKMVTQHRDSLEKRIWNPYLGDMNTVHPHVHVGPHILVLGIQPPATLFLAIFDPWGGFMPLWGGGGGYSPKGVVLSPNLFMGGGVSPFWGGFIPHFW